MQKKTSWKLMGNITSLLVMIAIVFYLMNHSLKSILIELSRTNLILVLVILSLGFLYQLIEGYLLKQMIHPFNSSFRTIDGFFASCYTAFYRIITFGAGTVPAEIAFYHKKGLTVSEGLGITTLRMVIYKLTIFICAIFALILQFFLAVPIHSNYVWAVLFGCLLTLGIVAFLLALSLSVYLQTWVMMALNRWVNKPSWRTKIDTFNQSIYALRELVQATTKNYPLIKRLFYCSLLKISCWYAIPMVYFFYEGKSIAWYTLFIMISFSTIVAGVLPAPAGIGSFEFVYILLFKPVFGTIETISSLLLYRLATYLLPFFIGFLYVLVTQRKSIIRNFRTAKEEK